MVLFSLSSAFTFVSNFALLLKKGASNCTSWGLTHPALPAASLPRPEPKGGAGVAGSGTERGEDVGVPAPGSGAASGEGEARGAAESARTWWKSRGVNQAARRGGTPRGRPVSPHHPVRAPLDPRPRSLPGNAPACSPRPARRQVRTPNVRAPARGGAAPRRRRARPYAGARDRPPT